MPAVIREADDRDTLLLGLVENVARENLSPVEEARGYAVLMDEFELSLGEVSERVGRSKPAISNKTRLLELPDDVLAMVERGELSEGHARAVLAVPDQAERRRLARQIVAQGLSVRAAERAARWSGARTKPRTKTHVDPALAARVKDEPPALTGLEVRVAPGKVELAYDDEHDLEELAERSTASPARPRHSTFTAPSNASLTRGCEPCPHARRPEGPRRRLGAATLALPIADRARRRRGTTAGAKKKVVTTKKLVGQGSRRTAGGRCRSTSPFASAPGSTKTTAALRRPRG